MRQQDQFISSNPVCETDVDNTWKLSHVSCALTDKQISAKVETKE
jgi:hypothetical protein